MDKDGNVCTLTSHDRMGLPIYIIKKNVTDQHNISQSSVTFLKHFISLNLTYRSFPWSPGGTASQSGRFQYGGHWRRPCGEVRSGRGKWRHQCRRQPYCGPGSSQTAHTHRPPSHTHVRSGSTRTHTGLQEQGYRVSVYDKMEDKGVIRTGA